MLSQFCEVHAPPAVDPQLSVVSPHVRAHRPDYHMSNHKPYCVIDTQKLISHKNIEILYTMFETHFTQKHRDSVYDV